MQDITPLLRTETLKELLVELFFLSEKPRTLSDLARSINVSQTTVMREVNRLLETGVVCEEKVGRSRTITINRSSPLAAPLLQLVRLAYDPPGAEPLDRGSIYSAHHAEPVEKKQYFVSARAEHRGRRPLPSSHRGR